MKKGAKFLSMTLTLVLIVGVFGGTVAFAESTGFLSFYPTGRRIITINSQDYFKVLSSAPEPPTVDVSDETKLQVEYDQQVGDATLKTYQYRYRGLKAGSVTVTMISKDGLATAETFVIQDSSITDSDSDIFIKSDTTNDLELVKGSSYIFRITCITPNGVRVQPIFTVGNSTVLKSNFVAQNGTDYYFKITAIGEVGQESGAYTAASGMKAIRQCKISIVSAPDTKGGEQDISVKSDTTGEFGMIKGESYSMKLTVSTGIVPTLSVGTKGVFTSRFVKQSGNDSYYSITAVGKAGQSSGIYTTLPGQRPVRQCKVNIVKD
jgi:hypothetical protein